MTISFESRIQGIADALNPYTKGSPNFYYYEQMRAEDILKEYTRSGVDAPWEVIDAPKAYGQLYRECKRLADKAGQTYGKAV